MHDKCFKVDTKLLDRFWTPLCSRFVSMTGARWMQRYTRAYLFWVTRTTLKKCPTSAHSFILNILLFLAPRHLVQMHKVSVCVQHAKPF